MSATLPPPPNSGAIPPELSRWLYLAYQAINSASGGGGSSGTFGTPGENTPDAALVPNSTRSIDYLNLGQLALGNVAVQSSATELNKLHLSTIVTSTLNGVQGFSGGLFSLSLSQSPEAGGSIPLIINGVNAAGTALGKPFGFMFWVSDNVQGMGFSPAPPDGGISALNGSCINLEGTGKVYQAVTDSTGLLRLNISHSLAQTYYIAIQCGFNNVIVSDAITFT